MNRQVQVLAPALARSIQQFRPQALIPPPATDAAVLHHRSPPSPKAQVFFPSPRNFAAATIGARRMAHMVRVIVQRDVEQVVSGSDTGTGGGGKCNHYAGDVVQVRAGYARNYLLPQKFAVYATRHNFQRLGLKDPDHETVEERRARLEREALAGSDKDLKARDVLSKYLRNKTLRIWRNVDAETNRVFPGMVDAKAVRRKLSRQLKIDLEPHERVHLVAEPVESLSELSDEEIESLMAEKLGAPDKSCDVQIRQLGDFLARITLSGGYSVPLKFEVVKR